jgi:hypothetical protein
MTMVYPRRSVLKGHFDRIAEDNKVRVEDVPCGSS